MRIGIDCRTILNPQSGERAGVGHYTYNLVRHVLAADTRDDFVLFFDFRMPREAAKEFTQANVTIRFLPFSSYGKFLPFAYAHLLVAAALTKEKLDVFHSPAGSVPMGYRGKTVVTVHDLAIYVHPDWFPRQVVSTKLLVPQALKRADKLIAVSLSTKSDLQKIFGISGKKVSVIPEAADTDFLPLHDKNDNVKKMYGLPPRYLLYVGTIEPRKNLINLAKAWKAATKSFANETRGMELILAGGKGFAGDDVVRDVKRAAGKTVRWIGYIPHNHKILLLKGAAGFVFPSWYEGFGIPALEAMQLGVPTLTSNRSSMPEVVGKAAVLVEPDDIPSMTAGIRDTLARSEELAAAGPVQAKQFSWKTTAQRTLKTYRQIGA